MRRPPPRTIRETDGIDAKTGEPGGRPSDIAVIGMSAVFPGAADAAQFWSNTLLGVDAITEIPPDRWDWRLYYDPNPKAPDKIISKWGGFLPDVTFDPVKYGMPPSSLPSIEPAQLLALEVVQKALADAGYADRSFPREQTAVVLGMGGGAAQLAMGYAFRSYLPMLDTVIPGGGEKAIASCKGLLPEWTEDSFPGFLLNVTAGRIANRLNLGGANYTVDAACGSSLAAAALAVRELETGSADLVILGGVDTVQNPFTYLAFSKTQAFSPRGRCRPFDAEANGIVISEGVAALVLKRLADAERDGDRIYAVIKGVGASSDGRARGLTAPVVDGQIRAIERAYAKAAVSPATVGYVEAHGTGTALGDVVEIEALGEVFQTAGASRRDCVVGSVKSLIGHTKCAAGLAGLINASLALYHKVLPPTIGIESPNPKLDLRDGPFRLCTQTQPWLHPHEDRPRRAGVSAFGFGGTNFHAVLEAYDRNTGPEPASALPVWPMELMVWEADQPAGLIEPIDRLIQSMRSGSRPELRDLSDALIHARAESSPRSRGDRAILAIVTGSCDDLCDKLIQARGAIDEGRSAFEDPRGVFFAARPEWAGSRVAFLFPGQGAQSPDMLRELAVAFPEVRGAFEEFERVVLSRGGPSLGPLIFPPPAFDDAAREEARRALMQTDVAQPAIGAACVGMLRLLRSLGLEPDMVAGHSYGELVALHAAGVLATEALSELSLARGRLMRDAGRGATGAMAALLAGPEAVEDLIRDMPDVQTANWNGPKQTVIAGPSEAIRRAIETASTRGIAARGLPVSRAFHTRMIAGAREPLARFARDRIRHAPDRPVYSNLDAAPHPADPSAIASRLGDHLASPVRFGEMIAAMHRDGARVFVEVGPGAILSPMVESILHDRPHLAISCDAASSPGLSTLLLRVARLLVAGLPLRLERLTDGRSHRRLDLDHLPDGGLAEPASPSTWLVNGSRARPIGGPEPGQLGTGPVLPFPAPGPDLEPGVGPKPQHVTRAHHADRPLPLPDTTMQPAPNGRPVPLAATAAGTSHRTGHVPSSARSRHLGNGKLDTPMTIKTTTASPQTGAQGQPDSQADRVIESFQKTMQVFLEVQKSTMLAYLSGRGSRPAGSGQDLGDSLSTVRQAVDSPNGRAAEHENGASHVAIARHPEPTRNPPRPSARPVHAPEDEGAPSNRNGMPTTEVPVPQTVKAAVEAPAPGPAAPDHASITARLLEIVRDRTGYPIETLGMDLDMEADLGIDSIKRVEILGKLRDELPSLKSLSDPVEVMDALARARTLGEIVDRMAARAKQAGTHPPDSRSKTPDSRAAIDAEPSEAGHAGVVLDGDEKPRQGTLRRVLEAVDAPLPRRRLGLMPGGRIVLTDDGRGVAEELASRLEAAGVHAERVGGPDRPVEWTSPAALESVLDELRSRGPIAGIVHALPLGQATSGDPGGPCWSERVRDAVKGLFLLAKGTAADLEAAARAGGSCLIAATALGGRFASAGSTHAEFFPGHGGVAGLVKTLAREWPTVRCRVVDLAMRGDAETLADRLAAEMFAGDGWAEVGYDRGRRIRLQTVESPLRHADSAIELNPGDPVVITGGARGITALVATELARIWRPTLLIVGTTPMPDETETAEMAGLGGEAELKAALHARLRREGRPGSPAEIETGYQAIRRAREVRENLAILRQAGAVVEYARADVRDPTAIAAVLDGWRARYGDPVGLIHGAGLIKDKLIREKTLESFDRVLGTKLDGALNLLRLVRPEALKFTAMFSSIAGRFGNVGQSDYASANEILNKLAHWLDRRWPGRVVSVIWGPWSGVGMVSQLERHLGRRGLGMISPEVGRTLLVDELRHGRKGDVEILYSGGLGTLEEPLPCELVSPAPEAEAVR
jgi:acyl transferase domain-containing protein